MKTFCTMLLILLSSALLAVEPIKPAVPAPADLPTDGKATDDSEKLEGAYKIVASEKSGLATPEEKIEGMIALFTSDKIVVTDRDKKEVYSATYKIDATQLPATISMVSTMPESKGITAKGLIEVAQDKVRLIYALPDGKVMPTEFKTIGKQVMVTLERIDPLGKAIEDKVTELK